jgi:hypothetical protein
MTTGTAVNARATVTVLDTIAPTAEVRTSPSHWTDREITINAAQLDGRIHRKTASLTGVHL